MVPLIDATFDGPPEVEVALEADFSADGKGGADINEEECEDRGAEQGGGGRSTKRTFEWKLSPRCSCNVV